MLDQAFVLFEGFNLFWLVAAVAGGIFGALIGANYAFGFTGVTVLVAFGIAAATGSDYGFSYIAFGPVFGPHVAFAGGTAATAYAAYRGYTDSGKDINSSLAGLGKVDVWWVAGAFGALGYTMQVLIAKIPWFGSHTDSVALTVFLSGVLARILFGKTGVFTSSFGTLAEGRAWLRYQEKPSQVLTIGFASSAVAAGVALFIANYSVLNPVSKETGAVFAANAHVFTFAISALTIFLLVLGAKTPVTHHITISAGLGAVVFLPIVNGNWFAAFAIGIAFGLFAAFGAEVAQRLTFKDGDTHIDPPAAIIWLANTAVVSVAALVS
ncbi:MAG: hypothetical protein CSA82_00225 [Actinobacteria bacterium]|nr:MAG: hypothetical protein CSA82_00225 [Actinomycetota bacterium]